MHLWSRHHAKGLQQALWPTWKGIYLCSHSQHCLKPGTGCTSRIHHPEWHAQVPCTATKPCPSQWNQRGATKPGMYESTGEQENTCLFPVLGVKTTAGRGSTAHKCSRGCTSKPGNCPALPAPSCTVWMRTDWWQGADHLLTAAYWHLILEHCPATGRFGLRNLKPSLKDGCWSSQAIWCVLGWLFTSYAEGNTKLGLFTDHTQQGPYLI